MKTGAGAAEQDNPALQETILEMGRRGREAARALAVASTAQKNAALEGMAAALEAAGEHLAKENVKDLEAGEAAGLTSALLDRLKLTEKRIHGMVSGIRKVAALPDPVGHTLQEWTQPNGIQIRKVSVPIGVIGIIFESRPNVTSDAAVLCLKAGNATILRGGREAIHSNLAIAGVLQEGIRQSGLPEASVQLVPQTDRIGVTYMAQMSDYIDCIIPRGGHALITRVAQEARMPVIKHYDGICHAYIDKDADMDMAVELTFNTKCQRPSVCNAIETLLVHRGIAETFLPRAADKLIEAGVELRGDEETRRILGESRDKVVPVTEEDWTTEYLDLILSVRVVDDLAQAIDHIERYGSHHSDLIVTRHEETAEQFLAAVDSATVYWNASTRFTDGEEFGFGAEIGISTDKLHARGPMALPELTSYKYTIRGHGQVKG